MGLLSKNIYANLVGKFWTTGLAFALVPLYIRFIGIEGYGLVGFYTILQSLFFLLDMGLSTTLNKEVAARSVREGQARETRDLVRTLEVVYWAGTLVIALVSIALATYLAKNWLNPKGISFDSVRHSVLIMGLAVALLFPFALYSGGLMGLQRQVLLNALNISIATVRGVGAILILWLVAPTLEAFFIWQAVINLAQTLLAGYLLWHNLPPGVARARFRKDLLVQIWRFAAGVAGTGILSIILIQFAPILLSKLLTLEDFGYYNLAFVLASSLFALMNPLFYAFFPKFSQLVSAGDENALRGLYHEGCQLMSLVLLPVAGVLGLFASEILWLWTGDNLLTENAHLLVSLLIIGNTLLCLMSLPGGLALASGWASYTFYMNLVAVGFTGPLVFWATRENGALGAAWVWIALNAGYVLFGIQILHRKILRGAQVRWYFQDVARPLLATLLLTGCARLLLSGPLPKAFTVLYLFCVWLMTFAVAAWFTPLTNHWFRTHLARGFRGKLP